MHLIQIRECNYKASLVLRVQQGGQGKMNSRARLRILRYTETRLLALRAGEERFEGDV